MAGHDASRTIRLGRQRDRLASPCPADAKYQRGSGDAVIVNGDANLIPACAGARRQDRDGLPQLAS